MITLKSLSKSFGSRILFENVSFTFNPGNRYGLTGPNGSGKTTLLKILMGLEDPTTGSVTLPGKAGMLRQNIEAYKDITVVDAVIMGNARLWKALQERDALYAVEMTDDVGMRLGDLEGIIAEENGYAADSEAELILSGMGIPHEYFSQKMGAVPTDIQFRVLLCQALFGEPQALLLDEPTNHLDLESIGWLERFLDHYKGTLVVISHDRHFLNSVCTHIADIDYETIIVYPGNYDDMVTAKMAVRQRAEQDAKSKEKKISQLREFVAKFGAGTRASQVQSRKKEMEKLQPQQLKQSNIQRPYIRFPHTEKQPGKLILKVEKLKKSYDGQTVIKDFSMEIHRGDKIGVIGNNGRGKSTLMKMLAGALESEAGTRELGHMVQMAYFPQNHIEIIDKQRKISAYDWLREKKVGVYDQEIRGVMGRMLFGGDDAFKEVASLSGGETARLIIAGMMLTEQNFLILDEPNNHLDLESVSALSWGLEEFPGTVIVVSHDRDLIGSVANKIIAFEEDGVELYEGNLEEYLDRKQVKS